jgi:molybdate transport system substrate-binding protein
MSTRYLLRFLLLCPPLILAALAGCGADVEEDAAPPQSLTVFAAASLTDAFREIALIWEAENPDIDLVFNFAGSNQLATQINQGAPADVFASADWEQMDSAVAGGRIDAGAPRVLATNRLVVVFPADNPAAITRLQDLAAPDTLIVLAAGQVPVGRYSLDFLEKAGNDPEFGEQFQENVLRNVVSYEENVRAVLNKVALGEADAGIVYVSDLVDMDGVGRLDIPERLNSVAEYPIAALNDSPHEAAAAAFIDLALGPAGQAILAQYGFGPGLTP